MSAKRLPKSHQCQSLRESCCCSIISRRLYPLHRQCCPFSGNIWNTLCCAGSNLDNTPLFYHRRPVRDFDRYIYIYGFRSKDLPFLCHADKISSSEMSKELYSGRQTFLNCWLTWNPSCLKTPVWKLTFSQTTTHRMHCLLLMTLKQNIWKTRNVRRCSVLYSLGLAWQRGTL